MFYDDLHDWRDCYEKGSKIKRKAKRTAKFAHNTPILQLMATISPKPAIINVTKPISLEINHKGQTIEENIPIFFDIVSRGSLPSLLYRNGDLIIHRK